MSVSRIVEYNTPRRTKNRKAPIQIRLVAVDDYGDMAIAQCRYTGEMFNPSDGIVRGAILPQANTAYLDGPASEKYFAIDLYLFHKMDANCNTCIHLRRDVMPKMVKSLSTGKMIPRPNTDSHTGSCKEIPSGFSFHPDDFMGNDCWEPRKIPSGIDENPVFFMHKQMLYGE